VIETETDLHAAVEEIGAPSILKTSSLGYDGKGQVRLRDISGLETAWHELGRRPCVLEGFVDFEAEFSVLLCRAETGEAVAWDTPDNVHAEGILDTSTVPARPLVLEQSAEAIALARRVADELGHVGLLTLEFFATAHGPVFNEMAPRVHNSGHWTIEGAATSQFENHIRAVCGLPLGATDRAGARVEMKNLIGEAANEWPDILREPAAKLHLYGKHVRPGRKMGHVTRVI
jgi:5-(carboxyamino)imidazole ribonucleotide synthase